MSIRRTRLLPTALAALLLAGCAGTGAGVDAGSAPTGSAATGSAAAGAPTARPGESTDPGQSPLDPGGKPAPPGAATAPRTVTGTVAAGVEPGCLLLQAAGVNYLLVFAGAPPAPTAAAVGARITVVGRPQPDMMTTCQQGTPFMVTEVRPG